MVYSHHTGLGPGQVQEAHLGPMGPNILYRNVYTGPRHGKGP